MKKLFRSEHARQRTANANRAAMHSRVDAYSDLLAGREVVEFAQALGAYFISQDYAGRHVSAATDAARDAAAAVAQAEQAYANVHAATLEVCDHARTASETFIDALATGVSPADDLEELAVLAERAALRAADAAAATTAAAQLARQHLNQVQEQLAAGD